MTGFLWHDSRFACDTVPLGALAEAHGTPLYVYSGAAIRAAYRAVDEAFGDYPHRIHYALKANSLMAIVRLLRSLGAAADANSGGEIDVALRAGFIPPDIVFTGVGKTRDELERAIGLGVKAINAESAGELGRIDQMAAAQGTRARVALRINPDIDAGSHPHISTGRTINKFGVALDEARGLIDALATHRYVDLVALHVHVGSQMTTLDPAVAAAALVAEVARELKSRGVALEYLDLGGGLGISYDGSPTPTAAEYGAALVAAVRPSGLPVVLEPGRFIVGPSGALLGRVADIKARPDGVRFAVLDAGMTELIRPALYGAFHRIVPVERHDRPEADYEVVGPLCESSDVLGRDRRFPELAVGDVVAILDAGAYGTVMASNYNRRMMPAEVLVDGGVARLIRRRQTLDDVLALES